MVRDMPIDLDLEVELTKVPDRTNLPRLFRDWELRDPLRRLEEALAEAEMEAIPRPRSPSAPVAGQDRRHPADVNRARGGRAVLVAVPPRAPRAS